MKRLLLSGHFQDRPHQSLRLWQWDGQDLHWVRSFDTAPQGSWWHVDGDRLWCAQECEQGVLWEFAWDAGLLQLGAGRRIPLNLAGPCHLCLWQGGIALAHYGGAGLSWVKGDQVQTLGFPGSGVHERQDSSHPHMVLVHPLTGELWCSDLGLDCIWRLDLHQGQIRILGQIKLRCGFGPRHMAWDSRGDLLVTGELGDELAYVQGDQVEYFGAHARLDQVNYPGHIVIQDLQMWVSQRGLNTLECYVRRTGSYSLDWSCELGVDFPRHFDVTPDGFWAAAGQKDGKVALGCGSQHLGVYDLGPSPLWVQWL